MLRHASTWAAFLLAGVLAPVRPAEDRGVTTDAAQPAFIDEAVLFAFDNLSIPATDNLALTMHPPEKHPANPVVPLGALGEPDEWQQRYYGTVLRHEGKFKMWYIAVSREGFLDPATGRDLDFRGWRFAYAESQDGVHWVKPKLGLAEFRGSRENNLIGFPDGFRGYNACVLYEPEERDPTRRFKMLALLREFGVYTLSGAKAAWVPLYSADGLRWRVADELVPAGSKTIPGQQLVTRMEGSGLYKYKGMYYLSGQGGQSPSVTPYGRYVQTFRSHDLIHWSKTLTMSFAREGQMRPPTTDPRAQPEDIEQTHSGIAAWNRGNVLIGLTGYWHAAKNWRDVTHDLGLIVSNNGLHFREPIPNWIFAPVGPDGVWDEGGLAQGQGFENVGDKTYIWYGQMDQRYGTYGKRPWKRHGGIGLLILDRDRFGSLSVIDPAQPGILVSSEISTDGPFRVWLNAAGLGPASSVRIELLDAQERPLPGYAAEGAAVVARSGLRVPVAWKGGERVSDVRKPFKLRAFLEGPDRGAIELYAIYVGRGEDVRATR